MILYLDDQFSLEISFWKFIYTHGESTIEVFSFLCLLHSFFPFWIILRVLRVDITTAFCNRHGFGFFCLKRIYFYDITKRVWKTNKAFKSKRPLKIDFDDEFVFFGDYMANHKREEIGVYKYAFNNNSLTKIYSYDNITHVHCVKIISANEIAVLCGDYGDEPKITFFDKQGNINYELKNKGQTVRAVDCFKDGDHLYYGTDTEIEQNYLCRFSLIEKKIQRLQKVDGPVFNIWSHSANEIGFTVSCEVGLDNIDTISICIYNLETKELTRLHSYTIPIKLNKYIQKAFGIPTFDIYRNDKRMIVGTKYYMNIFRKHLSLNS